MGYLKDTIKSLSWMGALRVFIRGLTFIRLVILARILTPNQFGLFAIASLALAFLEIISETGINVFFIQDEGDFRSFVDTAWIISITRGTFIFLVLILTAPLIVSFFNSPASLTLIFWISLVPFLRGFINPSEAKFQKELEFNKEFYFRTLIFGNGSLSLL